MPFDSTLKLVWRNQGTNRPYGMPNHWYLDFTIDGRSLGAMLDCLDYPGVLGSSSLYDEKETIASLLLRSKPDTPSGRVPIYGYHDAAFTVRIERTPQGFRWSDFSFETDEHDYALMDFGRVGTDWFEWFQRARTVGPFYFRKNEYWQTFNARLAEIEK